MKRWEWKSAGGRTFIVYAPTRRDAYARFWRIGLHSASTGRVRRVRLGTQAAVQDERRAPGA